MREGFLRRGLPRRAVRSVPREAHRGLLSSCCRPHPTPPPGCGCSGGPPKWPNASPGPAAGSRATRYSYHESNNSQSQCPEGRGCLHHLVGSASISVRSDARARRPARSTTPPSVETSVSDRDAESLLQEDGALSGGGRGSGKVSVGNYVTLCAGIVGHVHHPHVGEYPG